ncbi:hypothetical protein QBC47DRAFT_441977 [Echria macrotheca]|uniref:Peptidase M3A/M3B catalytic domain-containing protein n=1 Tax=Echria macrotheca TaxID=438768 RepID=A0AAJ0F5Q6_9PEZI|nr:hypothetical protein QBC47DRAFT_441977 [Echria macrotheca]
MDHLRGRILGHPRKDLANYIEGRGTYIYAESSPMDITRFPFSGVTPAALRVETKSVVHTFTALQNHLITTVTPSTATFGNIVRPLIDEINNVKYRTNILVLLSRASPDPRIRQAARDASVELANAEARLWLRADLAALVSAAYEWEMNHSNLDAQDRAVLDHVRGVFSRSGATLRDEADRARVEKAQAEISAINAAAIKDLTEASEGLWYTRRELAGCPGAWIATLKKEAVSGQEDELSDDDKILVPQRDDCFVHVLRSAINEETRRTFFLAYHRRCPENIDRLGQVVRLRDEVARLLGFENHAALKIQETMTKSIDKLQKTLDSLQSDLMALAESDIAKLVELKRADQKLSRDDVTLHPWDRLYYTDLQMKQHYSVDQAKVSEYFEVNHVVLEMLKLFEELFGIVFVPMPELDTWHHTVSPYSVCDGEQEGGGFLGFLYIDIFERPGKFSSQYHSRMQPGYFDTDGTRHFPVSALVCSYPDLLPHRDVRIIFHELGHAIHHLVERTKYAMGQSKDFGETPSKMLEHFVWLPEVMVRLSRHRQDDSKLPQDLANALAKSKTLNLAVRLLGLMQPAMFDLAIYTPKSANEASSIDTTAIWNQSRNKCLPYKDVEGEELFGQASFSPAFRGYDAGYFTYVMSEVYAADLFETAFARNPLSPAIGRRWRYQVLERGSSQPELEMLGRFLGRPLDIHAVLAQIAGGQTP